MPFNKKNITYDCYTLEIHDLQGNIFATNLISIVNEVKLVEKQYISEKLFDQG